MDIDILIPCAGKADFFEEALESVLLQSYASKNIYVIDNACAHSKYEEIVKSKHNETVHYIRFDERLAMTENWQRCLNVGKSELVAFIHDDDIWDHNYLTTATKALLNKPEAKLCLCANINFSKDRANIDEFKIQEIENSLRELDNMPEPVRSYIAASSNAGHMSAMLFKREAIGFPLNSRWMPDQEFLASYVGYNKIIFIDKVLVYIRLSSNTVTESLNKKGFIMNETISFLRRITEFYIKSKNLNAYELYENLNKKNKGYLFRLKQACFSWPLNPTLLEFGNSLIKARNNTAKPLLIDKYINKIKIAFWVAAALIADIKYFIKDYKLKNK